MNTTASAVYAYLLETARRSPAEVKRGIAEFQKKGWRELTPPTKRKPISRSVVKELWIKQGGICACVRQHAVPLKDATADHFDPLNNQGSDSLSNLRMMARGCNSSKGAADAVSNSKTTGRTIFEAMPKGE